MFLREAVSNKRRDLHPSQTLSEHMHYLLVKEGFFEY